MNLAVNARDAERSGGRLSIRRVVEERDESHAGPPKGRSEAEGAES